MLKLSRIGALVLLTAIAASPVYAGDKPAAVVNGVAIPQARLDLRIKDAVAQGQPETAELREAALDDLISVELMSQEAVKKGLDKQPEIMTRLELARISVLVGAFGQDYFKSHPIGEDDLKKEYEVIKAKTGAKEYKARHILVKDEKEAKSIADQLKKGGKFDKLAKKHSLDPGSKGKGGELDWSLPDTFVPSFSDALTSLKKGGISEPVQSEFGWHIIKLDDVRDFNFPAYQELKPNLMKRMQQMAGQKALEELRAKAKIE